MKKMFLILGIASLLAACSGEKNDVKVTAKTAVDTPNAKEFKAVADAIDNLKTGSKMGGEEQLNLLIL